MNSFPGLLQAFFTDKLIAERQAIDLCGCPHKSMSMISGSVAVADRAGFRFPAASQARARSSRVRVSNP